MSNSYSQSAKPGAQGARAKAAPGQPGRNGTEVTRNVHESPRRSPRGVRMADELWAFVDDFAEMKGTNASALIEDIVREKRAAILGAA